MYRNSLILLFFFFLCFNATAQMDSYNRVVQKKLNWGFRVGFDAKNAAHCNIYQDGIEISNNKITNQVGFQGALFGRINLGKFFFQPEGSYYYTREKYDFALPGELDPETQQETFQNVTLSKKTYSLNAATLLGYNIVKRDAFIFNIYSGAGLRYNYAKQYQNEQSPYDNFTDKKAKYNLNLTAGLSANIAYLYFDFRYEFVMPEKKQTNYSDISNTPDYLKNISIKEFGNMLSFSIGMMF